MATTRFISMHQNKGKSILYCLKKRLEYALNPLKTNFYEYVSTYECDVKSCVGEFMLQKFEYNKVSSRFVQNNVIAYHIRQAFKPKEVTPELANQLGYELGLSFTKGKHSFIVATHVDKVHIHNHIIFNSTTIDGKRKFKDFYKSAKAVACISDRICLENGLSIVDEPKKTNMHYGKWLGNKKEPTHTETLIKTINKVLMQKPKTFDEFLQLMKQDGYENKCGKNLAFKGKNQKKFIRLKLNKTEYTEEKIRAIIGGKEQLLEPKRSLNSQNYKVNLLIDIQEKLQQVKGKGYERWSKVFNLKQMANTINYLRENNLMDQHDLEEKATKVTDEFNILNKKIKEIENRLTEIKSLQEHIINYSKTRGIYVAYQKSGYSKKFYNEHETEIILHKNAKSAFSVLNTKKSPTIKALKEEYATLVSSKKKIYNDYRTTKAEMQNVLFVRENIKRLLGDEINTNPTIIHEKN